MKLTLKYQTGEEIKNGDNILLHGNPGRVELVACDPDNAEHEWHMKEFGGGVLIREPIAFGLVFIPVDSIPDEEDLQFVSRSQDEQGG